MQDLIVVIGVFGIIILASIVFIIYFIFKIMQFVIVAVNLYKKIINREDVIIKLLIDLRDNTKKFEESNQSVETNFYSTFKQIRDLIDQGRNEEAKKILNSLSDEEYKTYQTLKANLPGS
jgi:biopolymer transport protein ExbB/TolQ